MPMAMIAGGHDHNGDEREPLDQPRLAEIIGEFDAQVDAFAVASSFAVRNPGA